MIVIKPTDKGDYTVEDTLTGSWGVGDTLEEAFTDWLDCFLSFVKSWQTDKYGNHSEEVLGIIEMYKELVDFSLE